MTKKLLFLFLVMGSTIVMAQNLTITTTVCSDASSVRMTGPFWGWNINGGPEASNNGDGTWTFTFNPAPGEDMEYLLNRRWNNGKSCWFKFSQSKLVVYTCNRSSNLR